MKDKESTERKATFKHVDPGTVDKTPFYYPQC